MLALSRFMTIVLVDEYITTRTSCCCMHDLVSKRTVNYKRRTTVLQCPSCKTMFSRDFNAAVNILKAFIYMNANQSKTNQSSAKQTTSSSDFCSDESWCVGLIKFYTEDRKQFDVKPIYFWNVFKSFQIFWLLLIVKFSVCGLLISVFLIQTHVHDE